MRRFAPQAIDRERSVEAVSAEKSFDSEFGRSLRTDSPAPPPTAG
jgi:hypothetical protein